jgi:hypothetical protein
MPLTAINRSQAEGTPMLFQGARFWLSKAIPQRLKFKDLIEVCMTVHLFVGFADINACIATWWHRCAKGKRRGRQACGPYEEEPP